MHGVFVQEREAYSSYRPEPKCAYIALLSRRTALIFVAILTDGLIHTIDYLNVERSEWCMSGMDNV